MLRSTALALSRSLRIKSGSICPSRAQGASGGGGTMRRQSGGSSARPAHEELTGHEHGSTSSNPAPPPSPVNPSPASPLRALRARQQPTHLSASSPASAASTLARLRSTTSKSAPLAYTTEPFKLSNSDFSHPESRTLFKDRLDHQHWKNMVLKASKSIEDAADRPAFLRERYERRVLRLAIREELDAKGLTFGVEPCELVEADYRSPMDRTTFKDESDLKAWIAAIAESRRVHIDKSADVNERVDRLRKTYQVHLETKKMAEEKKAAKSTKRQTGPSKWIQPATFLTSSPLSSSPTSQLPDPELEPSLSASRKPDAPEPEPEPSRPPASFAEAMERARSLL